MPCPESLERLTIEEYSQTKPICEDWYKYLLQTHRRGPMSTGVRRIISQSGKYDITNGQNRAHD